MSSSSLLSSRELGLPWAGGGERSGFVVDGWVGLVLFWMAWWAVGVGVVAEMIHFSVGGG